MIVTGGVYQEICECPSWNAVYGSGGRAAAAIAELSSTTELHAYVTESMALEARHLEQLGVRLCRSPTTTKIAFAYFHPLSKPTIAPFTLTQNPPLHVEGSVVLRFGFLEGDAIVTADRAIYDPQTSINPISFRANGSQARELAVVLNEPELRVLGRSGDIIQAAKNLFDLEGAQCVIVKRGANGATVFSCNGDMDHIPAYRSHSVFKIGTGDVFSAIFSHYWAEENKSPSEAADLASRAVAAYAQSRKLPILPEDGKDLAPITVSRSGKVLVLGDVKAIQNRWLLEEARWCVRELGLVAKCTELEPEEQDEEYAAALVLALDGGFLKTRQVRSILEQSIPTIIFCEHPLNADRVASRPPEIVNDFATAIYKTCWLAIGSEE